MDRASNTVATEILHHGKSITPDFAFHDAPDLENTEPRTRHQHGFLKGAFSAGDELALFGIHFSDGYGHRCVGHKAVLLYRHIEFDQIAILKSALTRNTVDDLVVHADAGATGKLVDHSGSRLGALCFHHLVTNSVEFGRGHAGPNLFFHGVQNLASDGASGFQTLKFLGRGDRHE